MPSGPDVDTEPSSRPPSVGSAGRVGFLTAFRSRDFSIFWVGALVSNAGTWLQNITIPYVLYDLTRSESWVGLSTFCLFIPALLLGPTGGSLADRFERRRVLLVTQSSLAVVGVVFFAYWTAGGRTPAVILVMTGLIGVVNGLNIPSWQAFVPGLVPRAHLTSALTLNSLQFNAARAIGPAVGGIVLATVGASWAFLLNAVSFVFVIAALAVVRARYELPRVALARRRVLLEFADTIRYIAREKREIAVAVAVALVVGFFGNPIVQFTVIFAEDVFDRGAGGVGVLSASLGVGAVVAAPVIGGGRWLRSTLVRWGLPVYGAAVIVFAVAPTLETAALALLFAGGGFLVSMSVTNVAVQMIVSDAMRGRVMAARVMAVTAAYPIGGLIQGVLAEHVGPRPVVTFAGAMILLFGVALALNGRYLRMLDKEHEDLGT